MDDDQLGTVQELTRVTTQPLPDRDGDEQTAVGRDVYSIFSTTRDILKK